MPKRINVILSDDTVRTINRMARPGHRSRFIQRAVQHYIATASPEALRDRLKRAVIRDRDLTSEIAQDWFAVDQEQWRQRDKEEKRARAVTQKGAKSTSHPLTRP